MTELPDCEVLISSVEDAKDESHGQSNPRTLYIPVLKRRPMYLALGLATIAGICLCIGAFMSLREPEEKPFDMLEKKQRLLKFSKNLHGLAIATKPKINHPSWADPDRVEAYSQRMRRLAEQHIRYHHKDFQDHFQGKPVDLRQLRPRRYVNRKHNFWKDPKFGDITEDNTDQEGSAAWTMMGAQCGLSIENLIQAYGNLGVSADVVRFNCDKSDSETYDEIVCNSNTAGIVSGIFESSSYIAALPAFCNRSDIMGTSCAADLLTFMFDSTQLAVDGISLQDSCDIAHQAEVSGDRMLWEKEVEEHQQQVKQLYQKALDKWSGKDQSFHQDAKGHKIATLPAIPLQGRRLPATPRRLHPTGARNDGDALADRTRQQDITACYFSVENLGGTIAATVFDFWVTVVACDDLHLGQFKAGDEEGKRVCAADITASMTDIISLANLASNIANLCPVEAPIGAGCGADTTDVALSVTQIASTSAAFYDDCKGDGGAGAVDGIVAAVPR